MAWGYPGFPGHISAPFSKSSHWSKRTLSDQAKWRWPLVEIESMGQVTSSYAQSPLGKPVSSALQVSPLFKDHTQEKA